jgi:uncharacterized protein
MASFKVAQLPPLLRVLLFLASVALVWLPGALPLYWLSARGVLPGGDLVPTALLYVVFLGVLPRWERQIHQILHPWHYIGLTGTASVWLPLFRGIGLGVASIVALAVIQLLMGWATVELPSQNWATLILAGGLTAMAVGWAEELLFRGWLLRELERGWSASIALVGTSLIFALAHFIKPVQVILETWPQFIGLVLLGLLLGWARRTPVMSPGLSITTSLGYPVGLHGGLVWGYYVLDVGKLLQPNTSIPEWVTGLNGNPLAGALGIVLLSLLGALFWHQSVATIGDP